VTDTAWAQLSNNLVYGAMAAYIVAFLALAAETAFGARSRVGRRIAEATLGQGSPRSIGSNSSDTGAPDPVGAPRSAVADLAMPDTAPADRTARLGRIGFSVFVLATVFLGIAIVARGFAAGRAPWANMYEYAITGCFVTAVIYLAIARRGELRTVGLWLVATIVLFLGLAVTVLYIPAAPVVPALRHYWLLIHVSAATIAAGVFTVAAIASALHLVASRRSSSVRALPRADVMDRLAYRLIAFGFPIWTFAVVAGAIWAEAAWGRYWGWDPKEVWAFVTWVAYAAYLHARTTAGWKGRRASWVALLAYATLIFNFVGVNVFFSGLHSYGGL
jgi:cytochrome c-type biogenesis protein CcsB